MSVSPAIDPALAPDARVEGNEAPKRFDVRDVDWAAFFDAAINKAGQVLQYPLTLPGFLAFVGLVLAFWPMINALPMRWNEDQYYSHGWLVPFLSGFIVFRRWSKIRAIVGHGVANIPNTALVLKIVAGLAVVGWTWILGVAAYRALGFAMQMVNGPLFGGVALLVLALVFGGIYGLGVSLANRVAGFQATAFSIILALLPFVYASYVGNIIVLQSVLFVAVAILSIALVAGWKWALGLMPAIAFFLFGLPVWNSFIDGYTNPLQLASTQVAYQLLQVLQYGPYQGDPTTIYVGEFTLNVAIPCSGMKLMLAVSAFTTLFVLIANLRFWSNVLMFVMIIPLCLFINGLRIALIGIVGAERGTEAAMQFHDSSGYITLVVCFFLLFKFARLLGWKD